MTNNLPDQFAAVPKILKTAEQSQVAVHLAMGNMESLNRQPQMVQKLLASSIVPQMRVVAALATPPRLAVPAQRPMLPSILHTNPNHRQVQLENRVAKAEDLISDLYRQGAVNDAEMTLLQEICEGGIDDEEEEADE